jgi:hypothetical protein
MTKKRVDENITEPVEENVNIVEEIPVETINTQESEIRLDKYKVTRHKSFVEQTRAKFRDDIKNILQDELFKFEEKRQELKMQKKLEMEEQKKKLEEQELLDAFRKFKEIGLNPNQLKESNKVVETKNKNTKSCIFCKEQFTKANISRHMGSCMMNPESKNAKFLRSKKELDKLKKQELKQKKLEEKVKEESEEESEEEIIDEKPKRSKPKNVNTTKHVNVNTPRKKQTHNDEDDIW